MKLSIIIPIYGVENYLSKCVDSVLNQDYGDYEIILVDDGSPDACPAICDEYAAIHENIRVVHRENGGLSAARNSGIKVALGEYIMFVDSDDYIEPNVLGGLIAQMELDNLDVLRYNYKNVNEQYEIFHPNKDPKRDVDYSEFVTDGEDFLNNRLGPGCYAWQFVIKRELLEDCIFKEGIYFEDTDWTPRMLLKAKRLASTSMVVYNYLWREGSITLPDNPQKRDKVLRDKIELIRGFKEQQEMVKDKSWFEWMTSFTAMTILGMLAKMPSSERKLYLKELKSRDIFPLSTKKERMLSHKVKTMLANISPSLYCILMSLRK
jgi:glycosyltransferase involved in cell wall biosynthesis